MSEVVLITGASSGIGLLISRSLARDGYIVYAGMRNINGRNASKSDDATRFAAENGVALHPIDLDIQDPASIDAGIGTIIAQHGAIDILVHNAGHMSFGPSEAFSADQLAHLYDVNVIGAHRVNQAVLPHMRDRSCGHLVWISSSSAAGGIPPFIGPYFAAKAAMDSLAVSYAYELARWGVGTTIVVPGVFSSGTSHFEHADPPMDAAVADAYAVGPYAGMPDAILKGIQRVEPAGNHPQVVADAISTLLATPPSERPFRVHADPSHDGSEIVNGMLDRVRAEFLRRTDLEDLLTAYPRDSNSVHL